MAKLLQDINIGNNLRAQRKACNLTQNEVCGRMAQYGRPMLQSTYAQIETGTRNIYISDLIVLKQIFHCSFDDLFYNLTPIPKDHSKLE